MSTAIVCTYVPCTNTLPARIKADAGMNRKIVVSKDKCENEANQTKLERDYGDIETYRQAALFLCEKMGWDGSQLVGGSLPNGYVFIGVRNGSK